MSDRKDRRARRDTVPAKTRARTVPYEEVQLRDAVAKRTGLNVGERFNDEELRMLDTFVDLATRDGRTFDLRAFASVCLRAAARDYSPEGGTAEGLALERYAWLFVREQLERDRVHGCNMRAVITDALMQHIDMIIKRLK